MKTVRKRMVSDFEEPVRFFGRYTWKDLVRLGMPPAYILSTSGLDKPVLQALIPLAAAGLTGFIWYRIRPYGKPVDTYLYHVVRWVFLRVVG